ncbi:MAG TPA: ribosome recycling factor [Candidatus Dormibacteraeota bacterium]|nr:ribosome recycling factor [Candidatus Dormibacteraeota bacterium]
MGATEDVIADVKKEMEGTVTAMRRELARTRTGRASTALLEGIVVEYYGARTPLNQLATLSAPEARLLVIQPYDRGAITEIERAILQSDLGLVPQNDGKLVRVPIPELTEQRRRDLVKHVRKVAEDFRVSVRSHRRDANDMLKELQKDGDITEDDLRRGHEKTQELTKEYTERLDKILKAKEDEIMEV